MTSSYTAFETRSPNNLIKKISPQNYFQLYIWKTLPKQTKKAKSMSTNSSANVSSCYPWEDYVETEVQLKLVTTSILFSFLFKLDSKVGLAIHLKLVTT